MNKIVKYLFICYFILYFLVSYVESRIRFKYRTRPECRDKGPKRYDELPQVILTGFVEQLYPSDGGDTYSGSVLVKRVFRGPYDLENTRVTVGGFGGQGFCHSNAKKRDTWIFLLNEVSEGFLTLNSTLLKVTLPNLDRINVLVKDEPYRRRAAIIDLPCEKQYCENNGNCVEDRFGYSNRAKCQCLEYCSSNYNAVCGSNGETFSNECQIRLQSCRRGVNYFIRFPNSCEGGRKQRDIQTAFLSQLSF